MTMLADWFAVQSTAQQMEAARRVAAVSHAQALWQIGFSRAVADIFAAKQAECRPRAVRAWRQRLRGMQLDQPAALHRACPRHTQGRNKGETK